MKKFLLGLITTTCIFTTTKAADTTHVLFIGNSYTSVNNLPDIISQMASAGGDVLIYSSSTPGGFTLQQHCVNPGTLSLIAQGGWDYVVLQEQSQLPSFPESQVETEVYPFAKKLDTLIHISNPCAKTVFYMTWGRKNGDASNCASFPPICTYEGMDSLLQLRYTIMADSNNAFLSPVGRLWHYLRDNNPNIELYLSDESHPSANGSFAAACSFYSVFFNKNPDNLNFNYTLNSTDAAIIKTAAKNIVFDSLTYWERFDPIPTADFDFDSTNTTFTFTFTPTGDLTNVVGFLWNFGDGSNESNLQNPTHTFNTADSFTVCLTVFTNCDTVSSCKTITLNTVGMDQISSDKDLKIFPNPVKNNLYLQGKKAYCHYQIFTITGKKIKSGNIQVPGYLNLKSVSPGNFILMLQNEKGKIDRKKFTISDK